MFHIDKRKKKRTKNKMAFAEAVKLAANIFPRAFIILYFY